MRVETSSPLAARVLLPLFLAFAPLPGQAQEAAVPPHSTLVIFADRPMQDSAWLQLFAALRASLPAAEAEEARLDPAPELLRGDRIVPGIVVEAPIAIYLHGDCVLANEPRRFPPSGALGWVRRSKGQIEPFIHVDCTRIGQMLETAKFGWNRQQRDEAMSQAVARVILHEWVHIATQSAFHCEHGLEQPAYGVADLLAARPVSGGR